MRISDWSSDVCSSDLRIGDCGPARAHLRRLFGLVDPPGVEPDIDRSQHEQDQQRNDQRELCRRAALVMDKTDDRVAHRQIPITTARSEEHTSDLPSLMRISSAVFCSKKKIQ